MLDGHGSAVTSFSYRAAQSDGQVVRGHLSAESRDAATAALTDAGLWPIDLRETASLTSLTAGRRTMPVAEVALGLRVLGDFLESGLPLSRALAALEELSPAAWRKVLPSAREAVRQGKSLAAALEASPIAFPSLVLGIVRAGEAGSGLAAAIRRAAEITEESAATRAALRGALAYPFILAIVGTASIALLVGTVLPKFAQILADLGQQPPASTRLMIAVANGARDTAIPALALLGVGLLLWRTWTATAVGRRRWHAILLGFPFLGDLRHAAATSRGCSALAALLASGVPMATALAHAARTTNDAELCARLLAARENVVHGEPLSRALATHHAVTPTATRLARAGEESGRLSAMLVHAARLERDHAVTRTRAAVRLLEPAIIVVFGGIVAFVAAALLQALYSVRPGA